MKRKKKKKMMMMIDCGGRNCGGCKECQDRKTKAVIMQRDPEWREIDHPSMNTIGDGNDKNSKNRIYDSIF